MSDDDMPYLHTCTLRVRYSETDKMGIVYNANYLSWFEVARTELCRQFGIPYDEWEKKGFYLPVVEAYCRYKHPAGYDDLVALHCRTPWNKIKPYSVTFEYRAFIEEGPLLAEGWTKHAFVDERGKILRGTNLFQTWLLEKARTNKE